LLFAGELGAFMPMRYKVWQSNKNKYLHLLCGEGAEAFSALPAAI
jgi:hypothetical protein